MQINTNTASLFSQRMLQRNQFTLNEALQRLSSGLRINAAKDDAAGLAISSSLTTQLRGVNQATRNTNDGISMLQTAEGSLASITEMLQRARELGVQAANATNSAIDRQALQSEVSQILQEVDRVVATTQFNSVKLLGSGGSVAAFDQNKTAVIDGLRNAWLRQGEQLVQTYYGLTADGADLTVVLEDTPSSYAAAVSGTVEGSGKLTDQRLRIDMSDFPPTNPPDGGTAPFYSDRIIAHEMVHAVMGRTMNFAALQTWFLEGAAEFIHGADERLSADIAANGGGAAGADAVVAAIGDGSSAAWGGNSIDYSTAYAAVRYMHSEIKTAGGQGIRDILQYLNTNQSDDLDDAITNASSGAFADFATFISDYKGGAGSAFIQAMDLANADTGAIGGFDADAGAVRTATSVVPDTINYTDDPLQGFNEIWPELASQSVATTNFALQVGANTSEILNVSFSAVDTVTLGITTIDIAANAGSAISRLDTALNYIANMRADLGGALNRLEQAVSVNQIAEENITATRSRILDADFAIETAKLTKGQILQQAAQAMLSQAQALPQQVLQLLS